jgi:periplasmic protein TonB
VAALFASAIAHVLVTSMVRPGSARGDLTGVSSVSFSSSIAIRLLPQEPQPANDSAALPAPPLLEAPLRKPEKGARLEERAARAETNAASGPAEIPDPSYYSARQLDVYPTLVSGLDLRPAVDAVSADADAYVLLLVLIDATGVVNEVSVVEARPLGRFDDAARHALQSARFRPAVRQGRAVKSRVLIHVSYGSDETR